MSDRKKGLPESEEFAERDDTGLSRRKWIRRRWRKRLGDGVTACVGCGVHLNRRDTYYIRPAYTDGEVWLCAGCYDRMKETAGGELDHRYGRRRHAE